MSGDPGLGPPDRGHPAGGEATADAGLGPPDPVHSVGGEATGEPGLGPPDHVQAADHRPATGDPRLGPLEGAHAAAGAEAVGERVRPTGAKVWTLLDEATLRARVAELGAALRADYQGLEPILVSVLRGAVVFLADLVRVAEMPCKVDFMAVQRSDATNQTGVVRILKDLGLDVTGEHVLLVEDVVDTGRTLAYLLEVLEARRPASLRVCALLDRRARRVVDVPLAYVGFEIPDSFVFGYGLDLDERERGRNQVLATTDPQALRRGLRRLQIPER